MKQILYPNQISNNQRLARMVGTALVVASASFASAQDLTVNSNLTVGVDADPNSQAWDYTDQTIHVGDGAAQTGSLNIPAGESVSWAVVSLGVGASDAQGTVTVSGAGASFDSSVDNNATADSDLNVGLDGDGVLSIENGASAFIRRTSIGVNSGSTGLFEASGAGTTVTSAGWQLEVGVSGTGTANISDGASVSGLTFFYLGSSDGGLGTSNVTGGASVQSNGSVRTGFASGSEGTLNVSGMGSTVSGSFFHIGSDGDGSLNVTDGGSVSTGGSFSVASGVGSTGEMLLSGAGSQASTGSFTYVGRNGEGSLLVEDGGQLSVSGGQFTIGREAAGVGTVTITGADSSISTDSNWFYIGRSGTGDLTIADGGSAFGANQIRLGRESTGSGNVLVTGSGSSMSTDGFLQVGGEGEGTLIIENGGTVSIAAEASIARAIGSSGTMEVRGAGSEFVSGGFLRVGRFDTGSLLIEDGGRVEVQSGDFTAGSASNGDGSITVTGAGSELDVAENMRIAFNGTATFTVSDGAVASAGTGITVAENDIAAGAEAIIIVSGTGSTLAVGAEIAMGSTYDGITEQFTATDGVSTMTISDGGLVTAGTHFGMKGPSTLNLSGGDLVADGFFSSDGDSAINFTLGSLDPGQIVANSAFIDGTIIDFVLNFQPTFGDVLVLLDVDPQNSITGNFVFNNEVLNEGDSFLLTNGSFEQEFQATYSWNGSDFALLAIPEPSAILSLFSAFGLVLLRRNRA